MKRISLLLAALLCFGLICPGAMAAAEVEPLPAEEPAEEENTTAPEPEALPEPEPEDPTDPDIEEPPAGETDIPAELTEPEAPSAAEAPAEEETTPVREASEEPATEEASREPEEPPHLDGARVNNAFPFADVGSGAWYYESVSYAYYNRLMNGVGGSSFQPEGTTTRAMVVTVLWRMAGSPSPGNGCAFTDLTQDWYRPAVAWAWDKGIAKGVTDTAFQPDKPVTREQMATFIARYAQYVDGSDTGGGSDLSGFPDSDDVSLYARQPMAWANAAGLIQGSASGSKVALVPRGSATRAQVAAILMRYRQKFAAPGEGAGTAALVAASRTAGRTNQIITVVDHDLTFWERGGDGAWRQVLTAYAGYGVRGLNADRREGDNTTPIGAFPLLYAFGRDADPGTDMTYRQITPCSWFSSDSSDGTYNTWVESSGRVYGEHLADYADLQYRWGIVIGFNVDPVTVGRGSAIFLHCKGSSWNTAGCVSVESSVMLDILDRVNDGAWIIVVQNTRDLKSY